jgi:hypothetical protein
MGMNYRNMIDKAPQKISEEIQKGSFYQEMLEKMLSNK